MTRVRSWALSNNLIYIPWRKYIPPVSQFNLIRSPTVLRPRGFTVPKLLDSPARPAIDWVRTNPADDALANVKSQLRSLHFLFLFFFFHVRVFVGRPLCVFAARPGQQDLLRRERVHERVFCNIFGFQRYANESPPATAVTK